MASERFGFQAEGHFRIPLGDGTDAVSFVCDQHKVRWRENYHRESWTPELSNDDERAPHERDWTLGRLCEHRTHLLSRYREVEPYDEAKRHLVEISDRFADARWSRDAAVRGVGVDHVQDRHRGTSCGANAGSNRGAEHDRHGRTRWSMP